VKYVCTEDIENLAAQGRKELILDENTVLMELARELANQLGIEILSGPRPIPVKAGPQGALSSTAKSAAPVGTLPANRDTAPKLSAKPKGCQHGSLVMPARQERPTNHQKTDAVVDQLVELVRQTAGKRSGN
jgi:hypothetical protein